MILFALFSCVFVMNACGNDDEDDVNISSYIIGKWHSYKLVGYYQQKEIALNVEKNGANSVSYIELQFNKDGTVVMYSWKQDQYGLSSWTSESGTYTISGNSVRISDESNDSAPLMFDEKTKELYLRAVVHNESLGGDLSVYLYLKK